MATATDIDQFRDNLIKQIGDKPFYKLSTCDYPNWDINEHYQMQRLYRNGIEGFSISFKINFGVHDWVILKN